MEKIKRMYRNITHPSKRIHLNHKMDETGAHIQSEVSQKDKDQYSILTHVYGI